MVDIARPHAEIVGAGVSGLSMAILLAQEGWTVRVHERASSIREIGAGIFIKNNGISVIERTGAYDDVFANSVTLLRAEVRDHLGGLLQKRKLDGPARIYNTPRYDLIQGLYTRASSQGVEVCTNSVVEEVRPEGAVVLLNGESHKADLVVAADGFRSRARAKLGLTAKTFELSTGAIRALIKRSSYEDEPITREFWSGPRRVGIAPCTADLVYTYISCPESDERGCLIPLDAETWRRAFPCLADSAFFERVHDADATRHAYPYVSARSWSIGHVGLLGDAAHALPPTLGQGAGLALTNALALVHMLGKSRTVGEALTEWEKRYRWVTDTTQIWSLRYNALTAHWPRSLSLARQSIIWSFGRLPYLNNRMRIADRFVIDDALPRRQ